MLAAHNDRENIYAHQAAAASKQQLQAKTPGARFPKTPLKVPLNDENMNNGLGGKSALRTRGNNENLTTIGKGGMGKSGRANMKTPAESRTSRAPLGNKTTNAKTGGNQQPAGVKEIVRELEKTTLKPTVARAKQAAPQLESSKLEVHTDRTPLDEEEDIEYAPPRQKDIPYESDVFPNSGLTYEGLKRENLFRGYYNYYFNQVDENGMSAQEREMEYRRQQNFQRGDQQILRDMEEFDWSVGDVPATKNLLTVKRGVAEPIALESRSVARAIPRPPSTINSRNAAAALAMPSRTTNIMETKSTKPVAAPPRKSQSYLLPRRKPIEPASQLNTASRERGTAAVVSRSTLGYSKGRSALSAAHHQPEATTKNPRVLARTASTASSGSDCTITPARFAQTQASNDWRKPDFLSIFDVDEEHSTHPSNIPEPEDSDEEFQLSTDF